MRMKVFHIFSITWNEISSLARSIVPPLLQNEYKGSMGRIGFVGGSKDYTGAIYYSSESSLRFGGDLAFVFCSKQASTPIKCYSPELMVTPFYDDDLMSSLEHSQVEIEKSSNIVKDAFPRIHTLVVGPGLGRDPNVMKSVESIIEAAKMKNMP
jgi:ATP-dependent NAD(P)H-hydrate dehydratase